MSDPEDRRLTHDIAREQQQVIDVTRKIQRGEIVGNESQIPKVSTFIGPQDAQFRYVVIVRFRDQNSGAVRESLQEVYSDVPVLADSVREIAINRVLADSGQDTITGPTGLDYNWGEAKATIISVSQRL